RASLRFNGRRDAFRRGRAPRHYPGGQMNTSADTHSKIIGYLLWIFGFTGSHRFYFGRPISGTIWFFTLGLLGVGWLIDLFLIPWMERTAELRFAPGRVSYNVTWILLTFLGVFGIHRFYMGKWLTGLLYLVTFDGPLGKSGGAAAGREGRNLDHFCFRVEPFDQEAIVAHLKKCGVNVGDIRPRFGAEGNGVSIYLTDPEGNMVELKGPS